MKNIIKYSKIILPSLAVGLLAGWLLFNTSGNGSGKNSADSAVESDGTIWTCSMHPQIKQEKPGLCPICAMDLIPQETGGSQEEGVDPNEVSMTESAAKLASIQTVFVQSGGAVKAIHLQGKVTADERNIAEVAARFGGRIEQLFVNYTGQKVERGQKLATIYSPELLSAQKELLEAFKTKEERPALYEAARSKLLFWNLTEEQISGIEKAGSPQKNFDIYSPISGTVSMRHVALGDYVKEGSLLFNVVNLGQLWVQLDAYEADLPWIKLNDLVRFELRSIPGETFTAKVSFIDPVVNPKTRAASVRLNVPNPKGLLKPEMFVKAILEASIPGAENHLLIPKTAVLWTGKRSLVYVRVPDRETPSFIMREVVLGTEAGNQYIIKEGLSAGEEIVMNGVFKIDAAAQLRGLPSMMNPEGGMQLTDHQHGAKQMEDGTEMEMNEQEQMDNMPMDSLVQTVYETFEVGQEFQKMLSKLYKAYLPMKDAFVKTNAKKVSRAAGKLLPYLEDADKSLLKDKAQMVWMEQQDGMGKALNRIIESKDIEMQRAAFSEFNKQLYAAVKSFGLLNQTVYYQFCPMAFNDQGAFWLSDEEVIANPYFGDVMLRCGEVKEIIEN